MVDVEQRALRALEQDALAGPSLARRAAARRRPCRAGPSARPTTAPRRSLRHRISARPRPRRSALWCVEQAIDLLRQRRQVGEVHQRGWPGGRPCPRRPGRCRASSCRSWCRRCRFRAARRVRGGGTGSAWRCRRRADCRGVIATPCSRSRSTSATQVHADRRRRRCR